MNPKNKIKFNLNSILFILILFVSIFKVNNSDVQKYIIYKPDDQYTFPRPLPTSKNFIFALTGNSSEVKKYDSKGTLIETLNIPNFGYTANAAVVELEPTSDNKTYYLAIHG